MSCRGCLLVALCLVVGCGGEDDGGASPSVDGAVAAGDGGGVDGGVDGMVDGMVDGIDGGGEVDAGVDAEVDEAVPDAAPLPALAEVESVQREGMHPGGGLACMRVECPAGKQVLGGGGEWPAALTLTYDEPVPDVNGWVLCGVMEMPGPWTVEAHCAVANVGVEVVRERGDALAGELTCVAAMCPDGMVVSGGGGHWGSSVALRASRGLEGSGWTLCGTTDEDASMEVFAVCTEAPIRQVVREGTHPGIGHVCVSATCPSGMRVVGGGGRWQTVDRTVTRSTNNGQELAVCGHSNERVDWFAMGFCAAAR